jgi:hypothetical protein
MQAEVLALQQQAQATQQSLKTLQTHEAISPYSAIVSEVPSYLSGINSTMLGVGSALALASAVVWWYVWRRPQTRWINAPAATTPREPPLSTRAALSDHGFTLHAPGSTQPPAVVPDDDALAWDPNTVSGDTTQPFESGYSAFARRDSNTEFDPEAAASEVTRVRKYLAQKREARALQQDRSDSAYAELDLDLGMDDAPVTSRGETPSVRAWLDSAVVTPLRPKSRLALQPIWTWIWTSASCIHRRSCHAPPMRTLVFRWLKQSRGKT